jgi:hypothetical protein
VITQINTTLWNSPFTHPKETLKASIDHFVIRRQDFASPISLLRRTGDLIDSSGLDNVLAQTDVVHFHTGLPNITQFAEHLNKQKIVITMHDFRGASGACHQPVDCLRATEGCQKCPAVHQIFQSLVSRSFSSMSSLYRSMPNLLVTTPTHWMADRLGRSSSMAGIPIRVIGNPVRGNVSQNFSNNRSGLLLVTSTAPSALRRTSPHQWGEIIKLADDLSERITAVGAGPFPGGIERVGVLGHNELMSWMTRVRTVIVPSSWESFSQLAVEASLSGARVIGQSGSAVQEVSERFKAFVPMGLADTMASSLCAPREVPFDNPYDPIKIASEFVKAYRSGNPID